MKKSSTLDLFETGNADAIRDWLVSQLGSQQPDDRFDMFRARALALARMVAPVVIYMRDVMGIAIDIERIRFAMAIESICLLATKKRFLLRENQTGERSEIPVPNISESLISSLKAYLSDLPGYDISLPYNQQTDDEPNKHHDLTLYYFTVSFAQFPVTLARERAFERAQDPITLLVPVTAQP